MLKCLLGSTGDSIGAIVYGTDAGIVVGIVVGIVSGTVVGIVVGIVEGKEV